MSKNTNPSLTCMKQYLCFLLASYVTASLFELNANFFFDGALFQSQYWHIFFVIWYGSLYSVVFLLLHKRPLWIAVLVGAILGLIVETFVFHRVNLIVDPIIYAIMFFIPFWIYHKFIKKIRWKAFYIYYVL